MGFMKYAAGIAPLFACAVSFAEPTVEFMAPITASQWTIGENTPLRCELSHPIPGFGSFVVESVAGKTDNIVIKLKQNRRPFEERTVDVRAVSPVYRPGVSDKMLPEMKRYRHFGGEIADKDAWMTLGWLDTGKNIAFLWNDEHFANRNVRVTASAINFKKPFQEFLACKSGLLDFGFDDVKFTVVTFKPGTDELTAFSKEQLDRLLTYMSYDKSVSELVIDSYTDSFGPVAETQAKSAKMAEIVGEYLTQTGLKSENIVKNSYGEKEHAASNHTAEGRNLNRRVIISVKQPEHVKTKYKFDPPKVDPKGAKINDLSANSEPDLVMAGKKGPSVEKKDDKNRIDTDKMNAISARDTQAPSLDAEENKK